MLILEGQWMPLQGMLNVVIDQRWTAAELREAEESQTAGSGLEQPDDPDPG